MTPKTDAEVMEDCCWEFIPGPEQEAFKRGWSAALKHSPVVRELEMAIEAMMKCENDVRPCDMCCASGTHTLAKLQAARKGEG